MNVKSVEKQEKSTVELVIEIGKEEFEAAVEKVYKKQRGKISVPGFRKGKAPRKIIEGMYGSGVFYEDAINDLYPEAYAQAIEQEKLDAVAWPKVEIVDVGKEGLTFKALVTVRPEVKLGEYKHLGIEKEVAEVTDDDVNAEIERARDRASRYVEITDRPAKLDDQVNIDYAGFDGDEQFDGGTAQGHDLVLGSGSFIPGFEDQLVGAEVGSEVEVHVTFPEQYHAENLAGKPVVFKVKVNSIREKEVPALDEDFVKEVSETANTVDEYKAEIREKLEKQAEAKADVAFENAVIEKVAENAEIDIPQGMIEEQIDSMLRDMEMRMMYQGMRLDDYFKYTGQTREQVREMYKAPAEERVRTQLVIEAVMKAEGIKATDEEIDAEIQKYADQSKKSLDELKATLGDGDKNYFAEVASLQKTVDFLKANAK